MIETVIALVALLISGLAYRQSIRQSSLTDRLTEREIELVRQQLATNFQAALQEKKALVSARMFKIGRNEWKVRVYNSGPAEAKNVRLILTDDNHLVEDNLIDGKFPMGRMESGQSVDFWANVHMSSNSKEILTIRWDDLSGIDRENKVEITI